MSPQRVRALSAALLAGVMTGHQFGFLRSEVEAADRAEVVRARRIAQELESGRVKEAVFEAESAVARFPQDALLRRRVSQAHLVQALEIDRQYEQVTVDEAWAKTLSQAVRKLQRQLETPPSEEKDLPQSVQDANREGRRALLSSKTLTEIQAFQERARLQKEQAEPLRARRDLVLSDALADAEEARRLGDRTTELELTDQWAKVLALVWQRQAGAPAVTPAPKTGKDARPRPPLTSVKINEVLRSAEALGAQRPNDPAALAGAADVLAMVSELQGRSAPWQMGIKVTLDRRWRLNRPAKPISESQRLQWAEAAKAYQQARTAQKVDVTATPWTLALQYYVRAVEVDGNHSLPLLRPRLHEIQRAFEPETAVQLLRETEARDPQNAFLVLERARAKLFLEDQFDEAVETLKETAQRRTFKRSFITAAPLILRRSGLLYQHDLRDAMGLNTSDCGWSFAILEQARLASRNSVEQGRLREARLHLATMMCGAPDYFDAIAGAEEAGRQLATMAAEARIPAERLRIEQLRKQLTTLFARFPRSRDYLILTKNGVVSRTSPSFDAPLTGSRGWSVFLTLDGTMFAGDFKSALH